MLNWFIGVPTGKTRADMEAAGIDVVTVLDSVRVPGNLKMEVRATRAIIESAKINGIVKWYENKNDFMVVE